RCRRPATAALRLLLWAPERGCSGGHAPRVRQNAALTSFAAWFGSALRAAEPGCFTCRGGRQAFGSPSPAPVSAGLAGLRDLALWSVSEIGEQTYVCPGPASCLYRGPASPSRYPWRQSSEFELRRMGPVLWLSGSYSQPLRTDEHTIH